MKNFSRIGTALFGVIVTVLSIILPGCQTERSYYRDGEGNGFELSRADGPSCRFG